MVRTKRGQQAMEYMVTYGWAFVVIIVTIGAFAYFGLLNPEKYLPNRCDFGMQLKCVDYKLESDPAGTAPGELKLKFQNAFGEDIKLLNASTAEGTGVSDISELPIAEGEISGTVSLNLTGSDYFLVDGDKTLVPVRITFSRDGGSYPEHYVVGEVYATVQ